MLLIGPPTILSAKYENGVTTIEIRKSAAAGLVIVHENIYVYANMKIDASGTRRSREVDRRA